MSEVDKAEANEMAQDMVKEGVLEARRRKKTLKMSNGVPKRAVRQRRAFGGRHGSGTR